MAEALQDLEKWNFPILFITFDYFLMKFATFLYQHAVLYVKNVLVSFSSRRHSSPPHLRHSTLLYSILFGTYDSTCVIGEIWTWYYNYEGIVYNIMFFIACVTPTPLPPRYCGYYVNYLWFQPWLEGRRIITTQVRCNFYGWAIIKYL